LSFLQYEYIFSLCTFRQIAPKPDLYYILFFSAAPSQYEREGEKKPLGSAKQKLSPRAGDSSRARPVDDKARGESGGIGSVASGSKARRPYSNQRSWHEVPKGEWLKEAKCREVFPLSLFTIVHRQLPRKRWSLLGALYKLTD